MTKYSLVIYLDKELLKKIKVIQERLFGLTGSMACLNLWEPHITIGAGVEIEDKDFNPLYEDISKTIKSLKPFEIKIKDYGFMDDWMGGKLKGFTKYVIYINVIKNDKLQNLFNTVKEVTDKRNLFYGPISSYNPHLTIASKDLNEEGFNKAKSVLEKEKFEDKILVDHIALAKEYNDGKWKEYKQIKF